MEHHVEVQAQLAAQSSESQGMASQDPDRDMLSQATADHEMQEATEGAGTALGGRSPCER